MITSIFDKTRPINYLIIGIITTLVYFLFYFQHQNTYFEVFTFLKALIVFVVLLGSVLLTNFILLRNNLTQDNSFGMLFFVLFLLFFPKIFTHYEIVFANFFLLLSIRRLISLKSLVTPREKLFDASIWIFVASTFYFWSILFLLLVFASIFLHISRDYRNWFIPFVALFAVTILYIGFNLIFNNALWLHMQDQFIVNFNFTHFSSIHENIAFAVFVSITLFLFIHTIFDFQYKLLSLRSSNLKLIFAFIIASFLAIISEDKITSLLFCFLPLAVFGTNFLERIKNKLLTDIIMYCLIVVALMFFVLEL
jgi:hypothetical protein